MSSAALEFLCTFLAVSTNRWQTDYRAKSLYIARLVIRKGGNIHSRVNFKNRRFLIERWEDGSRVWVHPEQDEIIADHNAYLRREFNLHGSDFEYLVIDDRMPN